jgi:hypothetical protein
MQKTIFPIAFGAGFQLRRFTIDHTDLTDADTSQTITLFSLGGKDAVMGVRVKTTVAFTGGGVGTCTVSVGGSVEGATGFSAAFDIFQAVADTTGQMTQCFKNGTSAGQDVQAVFTVDTTCAALTAGQVDIDVLTMSIAAEDIS